MIFKAHRFPLLYAFSLAGLIAASFARFGQIAPPNPQSLGNEGYRQLWLGNMQTATGSFERAVRADSAFPFRWSDLGEAYFDAGRRDEARYCFQRAIELGPNSAQIALRAANFYFAGGVPEQGLALEADVLKHVPDFDETIFRTYIRMGGSLNRILDIGIGANPRAAETFFAFLLANGKRDQLETVWHWMDSRGYIGAPEARGWADWLLGAGDPAQASEVWASHVALDGGVYRKSDWIDNGGFEADSREDAFDWVVHPSPGAKATIDRKVSHGGTRSLRLEVDSAENLDYHHFSQRAWLEPGNYRLEGWVRTRAFTTDQGIGFVVTDPVHPGELNTFTPALAGTHGWTRLSQVFAISGRPRLVELRIVRRPSWDFDNQPRGTAWIDDVAIRRLP